LKADGLARQTIRLEPHVLNKLRAGETGRVSPFLFRVEDWVAIALPELRARREIRGLWRTA